MITPAPAPIVGYGPPPRTLWGMTGLSAAMLVAAFPPLGLEIVAWFALVPMLLAVSQVRPLVGLGHGVLVGLPLMAVMTSFAGAFGLLPWVLLTVAMTLPYAVFGLVAAMLGRCPLPGLRALALAGAWALAELARGYYGPIAFSYGHLAYSQQDQLPLMQFAAIAGHYGVGFVMALFNAGMATVLLAMLPSVVWWRPGEVGLFNRRAGRVALASYGVIFACYLLGSLAIRQGETVAQRTAASEQLALAAVQGNPQGGLTITPGEIETAMQTYADLSRLPRPVDLLVWPETAVPASMRGAAGLDHYGRQVAEVARREKTWLLTGAPDLVNGRLYNAAFLFTPEGEIADTYHKNDLVIFGEYVPFRDRIAFFQRYPVRQQDFSPGEGRRIMSAGHLRVAPLICFEAIFPGPGRAVTRLGAEVIVIHTSDLWAQGGLEMRLHSLTGVYRAIEARRPVVRAASNGVTAIYNPWGEALEALPHNTPGVAVAEVPRPTTRLSPYHRYGDTPLLVASVLLVLLGLLRRLPRPGPLDDSSLNGS